MEYCNVFNICIEKTFIIGRTDITLLTNLNVMETATLVALFVSCLLISFTGYALYTAFGQPSKDLRDPFEEHED